MKKLRLNWGENYSLKNPTIVKKISKALGYSLAKINLYPDEQYNKTIQLLAAYHKIKPNQLLLGNGIEGLIHIIARSYVNKDTKVAILSPSFPVYEKTVKIYGGKPINIPTKINKILNTIAVFDNIENTQLFFLAFPNNPTGHYALSIRQINYLLLKYKGLLVVDECYFGIGKLTVLDLLKKHNNLIVLRSFSKSQGLAGIRFGYALANQHVINNLKKYSYHIEVDSINIFTHMIVAAIVKDFKILIKQYLYFKSQFVNLLSESVNNIQIIPSFTTFILVKINKNSQQVYSLLTKKNIFIKNTLCFNNFPKNIIMFGVPKKEDWRYFIKYLKQALE